MSDKKVNANTGFKAHWRQNMREIVDALKSHMNLRSDTQAAEFLGISRQHLHISIIKNKLMPDRLIEACIKNDIDITRLLKDARATKLSDVDYSDTEVPLIVYKEGSASSNIIAKRSIPKWHAEKIFNRKVGLNEVLGMIEVTSDDLEPKVKEGSTVYVDRQNKEPTSGLHYVEMNGYGVVRKLVKAPNHDQWYLTSNADNTEHTHPLTHGTDFNVVGRCLTMTGRI
jgi:hypothetical protein